MFDWSQFISTILSHWQLWLLLIIAAVAFVVAKLLFPPQKPAGYVYRLKESVMTASESALFHSLLGILGDRFFVFPQVHLDAFLDSRINGEHRFGAFRHINEKSVDFLVCDRKDEKPILAIELDDRSHERRDRMERDAEVERIFKGAGLGLLRITTGDALNASLVRERVLSALSVPVVHSMRLQQSPFDKIKDGSKTIEVRLNDEKRRQLRIGDEILFSLTDDPKQTVRTRIVDLYRRDSFESLFDSYPPQEFGGTTKNALMGIYRYYTKDDERKFGVLGIRIALIR